MRIIAVAVVAVLLAGCTGFAGSDTPTKQEVEDSIDSDREALVLLECQSRKIEEDMSKEEAKRYAQQMADELAKDIEENRDTLLQHELAKDGYYCTEKERQKIVAEQKRAEQEAIFGPARELQDVDPGLLGGAFVGDVEYKIDKESTGNWMMTADVKELEVSTTADTEGELLKLAKTLREKEAGNVDIVRAEYFGGKKDLDRQTNSVNGTICIITSKDGLTFFVDQYPTGPAHKQAEEDFKSGDGIVFLGSME